MDNFLILSDFKNKFMRKEKIEELIKFIKRKENFSVLDSAVGGTAGALSQIFLKVSSEFVQQPETRHKAALLCGFIFIPSWTLEF